MKKFSRLVRNFLAEGYYSTFLLIDLKVGDASLHFTTLPYDVYIGGIHYVADVGIVKVDAPPSTSAVDKATFKMQFADPTFIFRPYAGSATSNGACTIRNFFLNTTGHSITSSSGLVFSNGSPIMDALDSVCIYKGRLDTVSYDMTVESGIIFEVECASPMAALDASNTLYTTRASLRQRIKDGYDDTSFNNLKLSGTTVSLKWGKTS